MPRTPMSSPGTWDTYLRVPNETARLGQRRRAMLQPYVRFGSLADIGQPIRDVRFTPRSRHAHRLHQCLLSAMNGHRLASTNRVPRKPISNQSSPLGEAA